MAAQRNLSNAFPSGAKDAQGALAVANVDASLPGIEADIICIAAELNGLDRFECVPVEENGRTVAAVSDDNRVRFRQIAHPLRFVKARQARRSFPLLEINNFKRVVP